MLSSCRTIWPSPQMLFLMVIAVSASSDDDPATNIFGGMQQLLENTKSCVSDQMTALGSDFTSMFEQQQQPRFTHEQLALICAKKQQWNERALARPFSDPGAMLTPAQKQWLRGIRSCDDIASCLCAAGGPD